MSAGRPSMGRWIPSSGWNPSGRWISLRGWVGLGGCLSLGACISPGAPGVDPGGRAAIEALTFPPLTFEPSAAVESDILGVPVVHLHDPTLPLVDLYLQIRGGVAHFPRREMAPVTALPSLIRTGGTLALPPDSVDLRLDLMAAHVSVGSSGGGSFAAMNTLTPAFDDALGLLQDLLLRPGFDRESVGVWRDQELERVRRREDDATGLAFSEFNRLLFGDHSVGWVTTEEDLDPDRFTDEHLRALHARIVCRDHLVVGVAGDLTWEEAEPRLRAFLEEWPACPEPLPEPLTPVLRRGGGVYILDKEVEQTTIILAQPGGIRQEDSPAYFASQIANHLLGASGFSSRLMSRIRTERGLAYSVSSIWTTPLRWEGIVGALTSTRSDRTVETIHLIMEILRDFRASPPGSGEVERALEEIVNGWIFAFQSPSQVVAREMSYRGQGLPADWLERYLAGIQTVTPESVHAVVQEHLHPGAMTILLVGDAQHFGPGLDAFGPLHRLYPDGRIEPWEGDAIPSRQRGSPRSPP